MALTCSRCRGKASRGSDSGVTFRRGLFVVTWRFSGFRACCVIRCGFEVPHDLRHFRRLASAAFCIVIPAEAGIQTGRPLGSIETVVVMDSRLCGNDGVM
ncbi:MAG: hypothetical protein EKK50_01965 [Sphingomonadaceae bacterium]|nr:MAG: hypothetical protein EKK50_01965 [Sphingomonadaceae bacterium]